MEQGLREKVGQLFMVGFDALQADEHIKTLIRDKKVGGVILFRRNVHTPAQVSALCRELQEINAEVSDTPLLISIDQEGGMVMRIEPFPVVTSNHAPKTQRFVHLPISAQVLDSNCGAVLAVTTPRAFGRVLMIQFTSHAVIALLSMPWPELMAARMASTALRPSNPRSLT